MRLKYVLFVLLAALAAPMLAVVVTADVGLRAEAGLENRLNQATAALQAKLEAQAAQRQERLFRLVQLSAVVDPLREAAVARKAPGANAVAALRTAMGDLFPRDLPEFVAVATSHGAQVVITSGEPVAVDASELPLAKEALAGQSVEGYATFRKEGFFRFFAAPTGIADGVIVLGERIGDSSANRLREFTKADALTFVLAGKAIASSLREEERAEILPAAAMPLTSLGTGTLGTGVHGLAFADPFFPVLAPKSRLRSLASNLPGGVQTIVSISAEPSLGWLGRLQVFGFAFGLGVLLVGFVWIPVIFGPVWRQAKSIEAHLARLKVERDLKLGRKGFSAPFVSLVAEVDRLTDHNAPLLAGAPVREPTAPPRDAAPKPLKPLDLPLAPAPEETTPDESEGTPSAFPFGTTPSSTFSSSPPPRREPLDPPEAPAFPTPSPITFPTPKPLQTPATGTSTSAPIPLPSPAARGGAAVAVARQDNPFAAFGPTPEVESADRTRKAEIPEELLARSRELEQELLEPPEDPDEEHFRQVHAQFVALRRKTGEGDDGLTAEKFAQRLRKNRDQLVQKYACRTVRFQVYEKDGKAAVKAAPVK